MKREAYLAGLAGVARKARRVGEVVETSPAFRACLASLASTNYEIRYDWLTVLSVVEGRTTLHEIRGARQ